MSEENKLAKSAQPNVAITQAGIAPASFEEAWRYANALAKTQFVPATYQGKPEDCFIAIDISQRLGVHPMMFLQNSYIVHGRPAMEAKLVQSLVNKSGLFTDPLEYEVEGDDPKSKDYRVRAFAKRTSTGSVLHGPWITWALVQGEGWDSKSGSKWKTMPEVMFHYRAASWFCNRHCPEVKMGFITLDEAEDVDRKTIDSKVLDPKDGGRVKFGQQANPLQEDAEADPTTQAGEQEVTSAQPAEDTATPQDSVNDADAGPSDEGRSPDPAQNEDKQSPDPQSPSPKESASTVTESNPDDGAGQASSVSTAGSSSSETQYLCKGCGSNPTKVLIKGDKVLCRECLSKKVQVIE